MVLSCLGESGTLCLDAMVNELMRSITGSESRAGLKVGPLRPRLAREAKTAD